jgi:hypothetical protein
MRGLFFLTSQPIDRIVPSPQLAIVFPEKEGSKQHTHSPGGYRCGDAQPQTRGLNKEEKLGRPPGTY